MERITALAGRFTGDRRDQIIDTICPMWRRRYIGKADARIIFTVVYTVIRIKMNR